MREIIGYTFATIFMLIPVFLLISTIHFYRKTKNQETEIAVLRERLRRYEEP